MNVSPLLLLGGLLALSSPVAAQTVDRSLLPADTMMFAHLDVQALRHTTVGKSLMRMMTKGPSKKGPQVSALQVDGANSEKGLFGQGLRQLLGGVSISPEEISGFIEHFGFDPIEELRSISLYRMDARPGGGVALVRLSRKALPGLARLADRKGHKTLELDGIVLHQFDSQAAGSAEGTAAQREGQGRSYVHVLDPGKRGDVTLIMGERQAEVLRGVRVARGDEQSLVGIDSGPMSFDSTEGSFLQVAIAGGFKQLASMQPQSQMAEMMKGLQFQLGEDSGELFIDLIAETRSTAEARSALDVLKGALALTQMGRSSDKRAPIISDLIEAVEMSTHGKEVRMQLRIMTRDLIHGLIAREGRRGK